MKRKGHLWLCLRLLRYHKNTIKSYKNKIKEKKQKESSILGSAYKSGDGGEPDTKIAAPLVGRGESYVEQDCTLS